MEAEEDTTRWGVDELEIAMGADIEERTRMDKKEIYWRAIKRGTLKSVENSAEICAGKRRYTTKDMLLRYQDDINLQLRISQDGGLGRREMLGFGGLSNIAASGGASTLLTPEAEEMKRLSLGDESGRKKGFFSRILSR